MANNSEKIAATLNRLTERSFTEALSARDQQLMSDFIADYFCDGPETESEEEEEPSK